MKRAIDIAEQVVADLQRKDWDRQRRSMQYYWMAEGARDVLRALMQSSRHPGHTQASPQKPYKSRGNKT